MLSYFILHSDSPLSVATAVQAEEIPEIDEKRKVSRELGDFTLLCGQMIEVTAFTSAAVYGAPDEDGYPSVKSSAQSASGRWYMGFSEDADLPEAAKSCLVSQWAGNDPMVLPAGVVEVSPLLSGVNFRVKGTG